MAECWSVKNLHIKKMRVAEMRMLRWMYESTRRDRISNETIQHKVGVALVADKIKETRPRCLIPQDSQPTSLTTLGATKNSNPC
ncbi:hypothetical protein H5410_025859 [Solanum commersonii]|uniref:Uncharacterized protein n=1 Tax=Solanum commersonii TaxID=4109 RepID=A0A9J5YX80_SOLCO|nr:hypothetical protein H5410_025859 [Solanum commersonii]